MNRNWNWQGWVAIALAGLALIVAMGGRADWGAQRQAMMWAQAPQAPQAPQTPQGRSFGRGQDGQGMMPGRGDFRDSHGGSMDMMSRSDRHGPMGLFGLIGGLTKLIALGLLAWLLFRLFTQRRNAAPPAAPAQTTPAGHDPTIE